VSRLWLTLGLAGMELCWMYPWVVLLGAWTAQPTGLVSAFDVVVLAIFGALVSLGFGKAAARTRTGRAAIASVGLFGALLAVRADYYPNGGALDWVGDLVRALAASIGEPSAPVLALAVALFIWWRGLRVGIRMPAYVDVESAFRWGMGRLVVFALLIAVGVQPSRQPVIEAATTPYLVGFFFVSLLTLALGRLESLRTRSRALALNSQWLGVLVVVSALVICLALLLGQLLSFNLLLIAAQPVFALLGQVVVAVLYLVVLPLAYVVEWFIFLLLRVLQARSQDQPPEPPQPSDLDDILRRLFSQQIPPELQFVLKLVVAAGLLAAALLFVARVAARWRPTSQDADLTEEERESLWEPGRLSRALLAWLRGLLGRGRHGAAPSVAAASQVAVAPGRRDLSHIRQLYRALLEQGEAAGAHRAAATTPLEHESSLERALEPSASIADLTDAYVRARYAEEEPAPARTVLLSERLEQVRPRDRGAS
jgi:hypothetical protein